MIEQEFPRATFFRRLAAMVYDFLVITALYMLANLLSSGLFFILYANEFVDPQGFEHAVDLLNAKAIYYVPVYLFNYISVIGFMMWFYVNGGQTLGMRAWRMQVRSTTGQAVTYQQAAIRLLSGLLGLGNLIIWFNKDRRSLQDFASKSDVLVLTKNANKMTEWKSL